MIVKNLLMRIFAIFIAASFFVGCCTQKLELYVAKDGSDSNDGTKSQPFATLSGVRDYIRKIENRDRNITIYLREGEYNLRETFKLTTEDSAEKGRYTTFKSYEGERVVISSGVKISDWTPCSDKIANLPKEAEGKIWQADLPKGLNMIYTLYDGDSRLPRARTKGFRPDSDIHPNGNPDPTLDNSTLFYPEGALRNWENLEDVELVIIPSHPWWMNILPLKSVDEKSRVAHTTIPASMQMCNLMPFRKVKRFFEESCWIENVVEGLDTAGEWVVNTQTRKIYLWPKGDTPSNNIYAPALSELVLLEGENDEFGNDDKPVRGIRFENITFTKADRVGWDENATRSIQHDWELLDKNNAMVRLRGAEDCHIDGCKFYNSGNNAIRMDLYAQNNSVENSHFYDLGQSAVMMIGYGLGKKDVNKKNRVYNCHIHDCGQIYWHSQMITMWQSGENYIAHNYIHDVPRKAICISGIRAHFLEGDDSRRRECGNSIRWDEIGDIKTYEEMLPMLHSRGNIVEYNKIHDTLEKLGDGSSINVSGASEGNIVRFNYIYDCPSFTPSAAIRTDNDQIGTIIENNVVCNIAASGIVPKGANLVRNNFFINCCTKKDNGIYRAVGDCVGLATIQNNIVVNLNPKMKYYTNAKFDRYSNEEVAKCINNNLYFCPTDDAEKRADIIALKALGAEKDAVFADPQFEDWENGDFRLKPTSPALKMGIKNIDISKAGLVN